MRTIFRRYLELGSLNSSLGSPRVPDPLAGCRRPKSRRGYAGSRCAAAELTKVEASAPLTDFERERFRPALGELLRATTETLTAEEAAARLEGALAALRSRPDRRLPERLNLAWVESS